MRLRLGSCLLLTLIATGRSPVAAQTLRLAPYVSGLSQPVGLVAGAELATQPGKRRWQVPALERRAVAHWRVAART